MRRWDRKKQDTENNGKKHRKSRWPACASAAAASFLLCACGGGGAAAADAEDISLYDRGLAVIDIMAEMTESEAYIGLTTANDGIRAIIQNDLAGEDGTVSASGTFLLQEEFSCGSAAEIEAFFEGIGVEAEVGEILPEE